MPPNRFGSRSSFDDGALGQSKVGVACSPHEEYTSGVALAQLWSSEQCVPLLDSVVGGEHRS